MKAIKEDALAQYRATARVREEERRQALVERKARAWEVARRAAELLRTEFGASKVVLFGSLALDSFGPRSDIDLAAWGIPRDDYFVAVAHLQDLSDEFKIDLVDPDHCRPTLRRAVEEEGMPL